MCHNVICAFIFFFFFGTRGWRIGQEYNCQTNEVSMNCCFINLFCDHFYNHDKHVAAQLSVNLWLCFPFIDHE